ncbi:YveK family protein [Isobaculum melis]|uniref:Capsular polysaccharide biosynthesis protein CpsC n=1 Tax=Isobaculum melis TaxID=142588 RepID=A0A1H9SM27_9LACT|nr:Wzz/FepE/Etk N-terminal domain-containing protein [Isobaculum melis]SER85775.1 Capsular polysaccharide biosynthesis protein [Isobaculum melis]
MEETVSITETLKVLRKRFLLIGVCLLVGIVTATLVTVFLITPKYQATTQILVNRAKEDSVNAQWNDVQADIQMINTYKSIIKGPVILNGARERLGTDITTDQLSKKIEVLTEQNSQVFSIKVLDDNPYVAADMANTIATVFQEKIGDIMSIENVTVISEAVPKTKQVSPKSSLNVAIGAVVGLLIGIGIAFLLEFMDKTVRDEQFIKETLGWTSLGSITTMTESELRVSVPQPVSQVARNSRKRV